MNYSINRVASRYAGVLLQLAVADRKLGRVHADIYGVYQQLAANADLTAALRSPLVAQTRKRTILRTIFQQKVDVLTLRFLSMVVQKRRGEHLAAMVKAFLVAHDEYQAVAAAQVTTVRPLSESLIEQVRQMVRQLTNCRQVRLVQCVDPKLIGGYILYVGDKRIDQSLRRRLHSLRQLFSINRDDA